MTRRLMLLALPAVCAALAGPAVAADKPSAAFDLARQLNTAFIEVAEQVSPSVVVIKVAQAPDATGFDDDSPFWDLVPPEFRRQFQEEREKRQREQKEDNERRRSHPPVFGGRGSGVIIREDGYIMTNFHVVEDAEKIRVRLRDGRTFTATIRGVDRQSDIAVLKITATNLPVAKLGDSSAVRVGEFAVAVGAPFDLDYSVTFGHISAKGRSDVVPAFGASSQGASMDQDFLQTDASINPGNSGGPLVNLYGEVIGVNTLIRGLRTGIGFAVPVNLVKEVTDKLISDGKFTRSWLGIGIRGLHEDEDYREIIKDVRDGVIVTGVLTGGPASKSDLKPGDVITTVDGKSVGTATQLRGEVRAKTAPVTLEVVRLDDQQRTRNLKIKVRPEPWPERAAEVAAKRKEASPADETQDLGFKVQPLTAELAAKYELEGADGLVVTDVERGSIAETKIRPGDIVTAVNHKPVKTLKEFRDVIKTADLHKGVMVDLVSGGSKRFELLKVPAD